MNKFEKVIQKLKENNMNGYLVESEEALYEIIDGILKNTSTVSFGGSVTLQETGVLDYLRNSKHKVLDREAEGLTGEDKAKIYRETFFADGYFTSTNAITEDGFLYNVDGNGNRIAAMLYGPKKVIVVCGRNKIVKDIDAAIKRNREVSAPKNAMRLKKKTPCAKTGYCMDCKSPERICREFTVIKSQIDKDRIHVIFLDKELGY